MSNHVFGKKFVWGVIHARHSIGPYTIIEYKSKHDSSTSFHGYIDETSTSRSWYSLDEALIGLIAIKHDGINTRADTYFCKGIGMYDNKGMN